MDTSDNMDSLDDSSTLPELSFDDLLDPSPVKKTGKYTTDEEHLEFFDERKNRTDDTLNTPGPKKPPMLQKNLSSTYTGGGGGGANTSAAIRTHQIKTGNNTMVNVKNNNGNSNNSSGSGPVLLNTKNVLPKTATQLTKSSIKITPRLATPGGTTSASSLSGKTAVRTSNGQIIYIQKSSAGGASAPKSSPATLVAKPQQGNASGSGNAAKPMTIQVLRTADGSYVPIKKPNSGTNVKNTTLTLSPTSLAGRKIITSSGGQVVIKGPLKTTDTTATTGPVTITTNAITGVKTVVRQPTTSSANSGAGQQGNQKSIFVQGSNGKQIIVSNQNIVKLSPKPQTSTSGTVTSGTATSTSNTSGSGQIHAIQIPGKTGLQYVRVVPTSKMGAGKPTTTTTTTTTQAATNQPVKLLNSSLPQKFTVVQKGGLTTKVVVQQKKDANTADYVPVASKVQKTIVTVPTFRSLNDDKTKIPTQQHQQQQQQQSLTKGQYPTSIASSNSTTNPSLVRKHKISEMNTEIQRITTTADNTGPPEMKKPTPNNRVVVISSNNNQTKILNNSLQQPGRVTTTVTSSSSSGSSMVQGTKMTQINPQTFTGSNNKLYTILKPGSSFEQKSSPKLFSVLKTTNNPTSTSSSSTSFNAPSGHGGNRPFMNKQYVLQQQQQHQKFLQYKKQIPNSNRSFNHPAVAAGTSSSATSTYVLPIKIKEEPLESPTPSPTLATNSLGNNSSGPALASNTEESNKFVDDLVGGVRRKHCNCSKSQCLKLYCDCFANGEFCQNCTCKDCCNNLENEDERQRAIRGCLDRNPSAFKPKITTSREQADMRLHNKGCNCKRSGCLKNYCECYEAKIPCSSNCKCFGCRNVEDRPDLDMDPIDPKIMASIANVSAQSNAQQRKSVTLLHSAPAGGGGVTIKTEKLTKDAGKMYSSSENVGAGPATDTLAADADEKQQCNFITQEVIDATIQCMITQADECEKNGFPSYQTEKMVMEELGRCLVEIIDFSIRNTDNSYSQD